MMYDQILDNFRKATEAAVQWQQGLLKNLAQPWFPEAGAAASPVPAAGLIPAAGPVPVAGWVEQVQTLQKQWAGAVTEVMGKHFEVLEAQYRAGIKAIDEAFRGAAVPTPEQARGLTEGLWKQNFESLRALAESQMKEVQALTESWLALARSAAPRA